MEMYDFMDLYIKLKEKNLEQKVWERWLVELPRMNEDNFISYEELLEITKNNNNKTEEEINGVYIDQIFF